MTSPLSPLERFLGLPPGENDPASLLGVPPEAQTEESIIAALRSRLAEIAAHPEADSPDADEVRMMLHAATANLLEPILRAGHARPDAPPQDRPDALAGDVILTFGMHGGWNPDSRRRLSLLAQAKGVSPDQLLEAVRTVAMKPSPAPAPPVIGPTTPDRATQGDSYAPPSLDHGPTTRLVAGILAACVVGIAVLSVGLLVVLVKPGTGAGDDRASVPGPPPQAMGTTPTVQPSPELFPRPAAPVATPDPTPPARIGDFEDVLRSVRACAEGIAVDADEACACFEDACARVGTLWTAAAPDAQVAALGVQLDFLYRFSLDPDRSARVVRAMTRGIERLAATDTLSPEEIAPACWGAGALSRLLRETNLPPRVLDAVRSRHATAFGSETAPGDASFQQGVVTALMRTALRLADAPGQGAQDTARRAEAAWKAWCSAADAISGADAQLAHRLRVRALEQIMTLGPDAGANESAFHAVTQLTASLSWRTGDASRDALLRWLDSPAISSSDLAVLTSALHGRSSAPGVDYSMVLAPNANEGQRAELRSRFAQVWSIASGESRESLLERWRQAADALLAGAAGGASGAEALGRAVEFARLNEAATRLWAGDLAGVEPSLATVQTSKPWSSASGNTPRPMFRTGVGGRAPSDWGVRYVAAGQHIPARRELLASFVGPPSAMEAELLVQEATRGAPTQVRNAARSIVQKFADEPAVINAMLEAAPLIPTTRENAELVRIVADASVPSPRDPSFRVGVRKVLVERLLQALAGTGDLAYADESSDALVRAYAARVPTLRTQADPDAAPASPGSPADVDAIASIVRALMLREAEALIPTGREPLSLSQIAARRAARLTVSDGRVRRFAAEQASICELLAYIVSAESPSRADGARTILDDLGADRRNARHIFEQVLASERAASRLWRLRAGGAS